MVPPAENGAFFVTTNLLVTSNQTWGRCPEVGFICVSLLFPSKDTSLTRFKLNICLRTLRRCLKPYASKWINDTLSPHPSALLAKVLLKVLALNYLDKEIKKIRSKMLVSIARSTNSSISFSF